MRVSLLLTAALALGGCKQPVSPTSEANQSTPAQSGQKIDLAEARNKIVGKMTREDVKKLLGTPSRTIEIPRSSGEDADEWIYNKQSLVFDQDAGKYYSQIYVNFPKDKSLPAISVEAR